MRRKGARSLTVTANNALANKSLLGGPLRLCGWSTVDGAVAQGLTVDQSAAAPAAGATIASISLPNGEYVVSWTLEITGTPGAGDVDNVQMLIGATVVATSVNLGAVGNYAQEEQNVQVTFGPLTLAFKAIGAATAGSVYKVEANIVSIGNAAATILDGSQPIGFISMPQGNGETVWLQERGVQIDNALSVQTTQGSVNGVLWYYLDSDLDPEREPDDDYGG